MLVKQAVAYSFIFTLAGELYIILLGPLLSLSYVNETPQAVDSELLLYADDTCLIYTDTKSTEDQLNKDFNSLCDWFIDNKLTTIHFGEEKTKCILSGAKRHVTNQTILILNTEIQRLNNTAR